MSNSTRAFLVARRAFLAGHKVEMTELAAELGVNRATVFRWIGGRDQVLVEVIWSMADPALKAVLARTSGLSGGPRIAEVMGDFAAGTIESAPFMGFVQREPERALRILTTRATDFQSRLVRAIEALLEEESRSGNLVLPLPLHDLAYLVVRMTETYVYADIIAGETPDPNRARQAVGALLRD